MDDHTPSDVLITTPAFRVVSKNSVPEIVDREPPQKPPYTITDARATQYKSSDSLQVTFVEQIATEDGKEHQLPSDPKGILQQGGDYSLLVCSNPLELVAAEIRALVSPFFYQDSQHTFYVEPAVTETTVETWESYIIPEPPPSRIWEDDDARDLIPVEPLVPVELPPFPTDPEDPGWTDPIDPLSRVTIRPKDDWVTDPATLLEFEGTLVDAGGGINITLPSGRPGRGEPVMPSDGRAGGAIAGVGAGRTLTIGGSRLHVVGAGGLHPGVLNSLNARHNADAGQGLSGGAVASGRSLL
jgi:hypothetical protein